MKVCLAGGINVGYAERAMSKQPIRHFVTNIICGCVYNKDDRKKLRVLLNSPVMSYLRFVRADLGVKIRRFRTFIGYQARSLLIGVNDKYIYKFPLRRDNYRELAMREKRVTDALRSVSPLYIPNVEMLNHNGMLVRKYDLIPGKTMRQLPVADVLRHKNKLARQVARFLFDVARCDPVEIRDLKPRPNMRPGYMCGWCQGDICDNFIINLKTWDIVAFIDWEDCAFGDFSHLLDWDQRSPARELMAAVRAEYKKLYDASQKK